ncbi:peptidylprolyl isomerase [Hydrogenophaga crassostreae]|uniref:Periplasmic chaperone PpiD n=1 Tax=Hydrogenophaga crassostreae TaxID=1763535 RepID=A0A162SYT4_9BURK|nr:SurA N-terminal domain-containing protein [Hydrogenophaga crassostreae]AOW13802.1 peptidylprolyl isomerase [Hydrogenophaga crassostreae]OAD44233.1 peptidylprolyl isomerase [Hydrogenophaga crassostreae]
MFDSIRNHKTYLMGFLLILIIPGFVLFGVQGLADFNPGSEAVASVNGDKITQAEWDFAHRNEVQELRQSNPSLDAKLLDSPEVKYASLERLVRDRLLRVAAEKFHLQTSDQTLARALQEDPAIAALRGADGKLDIEGYKQYALRRGMTPEVFEANMRNELSFRQVALGVAGSGFTPASVADVALNAYFERREIQVQRFTASDFSAQVKPTDAEIETFYKENSDQFQAPEQADVEFVMLDAEALQKSIVLNAADVKSYYDQNAARLAGPEERQASHILLAVTPNTSAEDKAALRAKAQALLEQVRKAPETFADVAKAESKDPGSAANGGDLGYFGRGAMVKPFEDVVFALDKGAISDVVETDFGFHIIKLIDIKAPKAKPFEEMRAQIEQDLKQQEAQKLFSASAEKFSNLVYEQAGSLQPAADELKLEVQSFKGLTRNPGPDAGVLNNAKLVDAIFASETRQNKHNTEAVDIGSSRLVSARVVQYQAARTRPLAEVKESVRALLVARRSADLAVAEGEKKLQEWKSGGDASALPAAITVSRDKPEGQPVQLMKAALSADPKQLPIWVGVKLDGQGYAVVKVSKVLPRVPRDEASGTQEVQQYGQWWTAAESLAYYELLKERFKVKMMVADPRK